MLLGPEAECKDKELTNEACLLILSGHKIVPPLLPPMLLGIGGIGRMVTLSPFFKHTTYTIVWLVTRTSSLFEPEGGFTLPILAVVCTIQKVFNT